MDFGTISRHGYRWPYEQVAGIIRAAIASGELQPGDQLPSQPRLAQMADMSKPVIQAAYAMLREEGLIYTRPKRGTFVAERDSE